MFAAESRAGKTIQHKETQTPVELAKDTPTADPDAQADPNQTAQGHSKAPGGKDAPAQSAYDMSHGQEEYPGPGAGGESAKTGEQPNGTA